MSTRLHLLGRPRVDHGGASTALPAERRCQLLALLALRRGWVARAELAALFWPGQPRALAQTNLRKALHFARLLPWASALEVQGGAVRFVVATDLHDIEQALREGRTAAALELCRGELLDGMDELSNAAWTDWLDAERAQHARRLHELTRARLAQLRSDPNAAAAFARELLDADPLDEDAVVALLAALRELGAFDQQRDAYRAFALRLEEELGVAPSQRVASQLRAAAAPAADGFIGRARELDELAALLARDECRLLTVAGPGGVGKSSLLKHALKQLGSRFQDGALWIALDDLSDAAQATARIAAELKLAPAAQQDPLAFVCEQLQARQLLLVLDNAEHLAGLPRLVERLLDAAPLLKICTTSRERLQLRGERLLPLHGLALPVAQAGDNELLASDAARLFSAGATAAQPDFDARREAVAIGELVHAVGGLPLAILLAAHWVRLLPVAEITAELERSLDVLDSGDEGEERPEHRSMRATFERSWQMLATREQQALAALSVFVGSFSRRAAHEVAGAALPLLAALADKSLLQMPPGGRCSLHPLIRQFAAGKLDADASAAAHRRHAEHFHRLLADAAPAAEAAEQATLDIIANDLENCRQAWHWAIAQRATAALAATAPALKQYFNVRGRVAEGLALLEAARAVVADAAPDHAAVLLAAIAQTQYRLSRLDEAAASARQGIRRARAGGHHAALVRCLSVLGTCCWQWGRHQEARRLLEQAVRRASADADARGAALAQHNLALVEKALGNHARAVQLMQDWLLVQRELGDWLRVAMGLSNLAYVYQAQGEWQLARQCLEEGLALCDTRNLPMPRPAMLANLAHSHAMAGRLDDAERISRSLVDEARGKGLSDVEATALNQCVRVAILRGDRDAARATLREAAACAAAIGIEYVQLDCVFSYARLLALEGRADAAAPLLRYFLARPDLEPVDRTEAQAWLDRLPPQAQHALPSDTELAALVQRIVGEIGAPPADASSRQAAERGGTRAA